MIYVQYQNSQKLKQLCELTAAAVGYTDLQREDFIVDYLSIDTANTAGLDNWGRILGQSRVVPIGDDLSGVFGFDDGDIPVSDQYPQNFDNGTFYTPTTATTISLDNEQYRKLLKLIYRKYNTNNTLAQLNEIIQAYSGTRGESYVIESGTMEITYYFGYVLEDWETYLFYNTPLLPRPSGVSLDITGGI